MTAGDRVNPIRPLDEVQVCEPCLMSPERSDEVMVDLEPDEVRMLIIGLVDWGGPAYGSDALAVAMGFRDMEDLDTHSDVLVDRLARRQPMTVRDWTRALVATEIAFASEVLGTGSEWEPINGGDDLDWLRILRRLQTKIPADPTLLEEPAETGYVPATTQHRVREWPNGSLFLITPDAD